MKIGLVCPYNIYKGGGVYEVVAALHGGLAARRHQVRIITFRPREAAGEQPPDVIFVGSGADFKSPTHTTPQVSVTISTELIDDMLEAEGFDVLHFHEPWVPMLSRQILSRSQAVNIATFHAKVPESVVSQTVIKAVTPYMKSVLKYLHEFTAVSDSGAEYVRSLSDRPVTIIPNGIDLGRYKSPARRPLNEPKIILFVGRLEKRKGVKYLLQAYDRLRQSYPGVRLVLAGDGPDRQKLEALVRDMDLPDVSFLGFVEEAEKLRLLRQADVFCSPAMYGESFGIVLLEAMASGAVTVAGNNSGYVSVMQELGRLSIINPEDIEEVARRLELLLTEKPLQDLWRQWAAGYVKRFDYAAVIDQYEALYEKALASHRQ